MTVRGQAKKGTTYFVRIATAYVIWRQVRLSLAVRFVLPGESALETLEFLLECLKKLHFSSKVLYLDKGFASTSIIRFLEKRQQPAILACPIRGKTKGIRALCQGSASYRTVHTFTDGTQAVVALKASLVPDKTGKRRRKWLAFIIICLDWQVEKIYQEYRRRFGIECSYRMVRRVRATTTSRNPALRFFLLGIGLLLLNAWVFLRWEFAQLVIFLNPEDILTLTKPPESPSPLELVRHVEFLRSTGQDADSYALALWRKVGSALMTVAMLLLSIPFVFGSIRTGLSNKLVFAALIGIAVYLLDQIIASAGLILRLNPALIALVPGLLMIILANVWLRRTF